MHEWTRTAGKSMPSAPLRGAGQVVSPGSSDLRTEGDFHLVNQLLRSPRYDIPEHLRKKAVNCIEATLDNAENPDKTKLEAIKTLSALDKHNIDLVKLAMPKKIENFNPRKVDDDELLGMVQEIIKRCPSILPAESITQARQ